MRIKVHGHRGARARRPENTLPGFRYAIDLGVDAVELDVWVTSDDIPVVLHDPFIGDPKHPVRSLTLAQLGSRVPTFDEVFALGLGNAVWFNVEAKIFPDRPDLAPDPAPFAELILDLVRRHGVAKRVIIQSFHAPITRAVQRLDPQLPRSALWETDRDWSEAAREFAATMLGPRHDFVTPDRVARAHAAGFEVVPWTANLPEDWARLGGGG